MEQPCEVPQVNSLEGFFVFVLGGSQGGSWLSFEKTRRDLQPHSPLVSWAAAHHITDWWPNKQGLRGRWFRRCHAWTNRPTLTLCKYRQSFLNFGCKKSFQTKTQSCSDISNVSALVSTTVQSAAFSLSDTLWLFLLKPINKTRMFFSLKIYL